MSPFMIFALVLTTAYAIYYAVVIAKDLQGKKGGTNSTEEVFDLGGMEEEKSVQVVESGESFLVGDSDERIADPVEKEEEAGRKQPAEKPRNAAEEKKERIRSAMYEADIASGNGMPAPELNELLQGTHQYQTLFKPQIRTTRNEI